MPAGLPYEPSVQAVFEECLPAGYCLYGDARALRARGSWPVIVGAMGVGRLDGGEILLVPAGRAADVGNQMAALAREGVAGLVLTGLSVEAQSTVAAHATLAVATVAVAVDLRRLQDDISRYILRRRRELFTFEQEVHQALVGAAVAGDTAARIVELAHKLRGGVVIVELDGEIMTSGTGLQEPAQIVQRVYANFGRDDGPTVWTDGPSRCCAVPLVTGGDRRGVVMVCGDGTSSPDEDELFVVTLAAACAIVAGRMPADRLPPLPEVLQGAWQAGAHFRDARTQWTALAARARPEEIARLHRSLALELDARGMSAVLALDGDVMIALVAAADDTPWAAVRAAVATRLGNSDLRLGISRPHPGLAGARQGADEAREALQFAPLGEPIGRYEDVEVRAFLAQSPAGRDLVQSRLGPLLSDDPGMADLLHTLRGYLLAGRNARAAAEALQIHRNTLPYRLRRIEEVLGVDLTDADDLFTLELAIRMRDARAPSPEGYDLSGSGDTG